MRIVVPGDVDKRLARQTVLPSETFALAPNMTEAQIDAISYVIEQKRFVEAVTTRCFASTILDQPSSVEPVFVLITQRNEVRTNATSPAELLRTLGFEPKKRTTIFVHGFTQSYPSTTWLRRARALFEINATLNNRNLIIMDWGTASHGSYAQVAASVNLMGSYLSNYISKLIELGADRSSINIVGHSLGAHVAGFAGKRLRPRIGRITALDPAGPCFGKLFSNSAQDRLSPDDAIQVDVYHYDDDFLGLPGQHGQFDVYVNGGAKQPGCKGNMNSMFQALITMVFRRNRVLSESHTRSTEVPTVQLATSQCQHVAYECRDWDAFKRGECGYCDDVNSQCFLMDFDYQYASPTTPAVASVGNGPNAAAQHQMLADERNAAVLVAGTQLRTSFPGKRLFISTPATEPFCAQHYQILVRYEIRLASAAGGDLNQLHTNKWQWRVELMNERDERISLNIVNQMNVNTHSHLLLIDIGPPKRVRSARVQLRAGDNSPLVLVGAQEVVAPSAQLAARSKQQAQQQQLQQQAQIRLISLESNFMSHISPQTRRAYSTRLCPSGAFMRRAASDNSIASADLDDVWLQLEECRP